VTWNDESKMECDWQTDGQTRKIYILNDIPFNVGSLPKMGVALKKMAETQTEKSRKGR